MEFTIAGDASKVASQNVDVGLPERAPRSRAGPQRAVKKSLAGLPIQELDNSRFSVPVLHPGQDGLPFSLSLDLYRSRQDAPITDLRAKPEEGLFSLQYILDGEGQLVRARGTREVVSPGDSILGPHGHTFIQAQERSSAEGVARNDGWQMASITLLLPRDGAATHTAGSADGAAERAVRSWTGRAAAGVLSTAEVARIVAGAKDTARVASVRQPEDSQSTEQLEANQYIGLEIGAMEMPGPQDAPAPTAAPRQPLESCTSTDVTDKASSSPSGAASVAALKAEPAAVSRTEARNVQGGSLTAAGAQTTSESTYYSTFAAIKNSLQSLASWRSSADSGSSEVLKRSLSDLAAFRLPNQTNRLALIFDPLGHNVDFTFGVEIFEPGHCTTPHTHLRSHELFFILAGEGEGFCDDERFPLSAGDVVVFPPGSVHGIDVNDSAKMYCLETMCPGDDVFTELVRAGIPVGGLLDDDLCAMIARGCPGM